MNFSLSTVINTTITASFLIGLIMLSMHSRRFLKYANIHAVLFLCVLITVRLLFPFEFFFTRNINVPHLWGNLYSVLYRNVYLWDIRLRLIDVLFFIWFLAVLWKLWKTLRNYRQTRKMTESFSPVTDTFILSVLEQVNVQYSHPVSIRLVSSGQATCPCILGIYHPVMIVPDTELTEKEWNFLISHELAHYYNRHLHLKLLLELLLTIYFWNPLLWMLKRQVDRWMEFSADDAATRFLTPLEKIDYAEFLLRMTRIFHEHKQQSCYGIDFSSAQPSELSQRMNILLEKMPDRMPAEKNLLISGIACFLIVISYLFMLEPYCSSAPQEITNFTLYPDETYYRPNPDGSYDVINNGNYITTVTQIFDTNIPIQEE